MAGNDEESEAVASDAASLEQVRRVLDERERRADERAPPQSSFNTKWGATYARREGRFLERPYGVPEDSRAVSTTGTYAVEPAARPRPRAEVVLAIVALA